MQNRNPPHSKPHAAQLLAEKGAVNIEVDNVMRKTGRDGLREGVAVKRDGFAALSIGFSTPGANFWKIQLKILCTQANLQQLHARQNSRHMSANCAVHGERVLPAW
jgi:hypothetical protein